MPMQTWVGVGSVRGGRRSSGLKRKTDGIDRLHKQDTRGHEHICLISRTRTNRPTGGERERERERDRQFQKKRTETDKRDRDRDR